MFDFTMTLKLYDKSVRTRHLKEVVAKICAVCCSRFVKLTSKHLRDMQSSMLINMFKTNTYFVNHFLLAVLVNTFKIQTT